MWSEVKIDIFFNATSFAPDASRTRRTGQNKDFRSTARALDQASNSLGPCSDDHPPRLASPRFRACELFSISEARDHVGQRQRQRPPRSRSDSIRRVSCHRRRRSGTVAFSGA